MKAIILAAGYATRLYPLTLNKAKALLPLNGVPIIDYILDKINKVKDIDEILVISNNKFYKDFKNWASEKININLKVLNDNTVNDATKKGSIGDIQFVIENENIEDDILIVAGDNFFTFNLEDYYKFYSYHNMDCVCVKKINNTEVLKRFGVAILDNNGIILDFEEKPKNPKSNIGVYAAYIYKKDTIPLIKLYLDEGNKSDAPGYFVQWLCKKKSIMAYKFEGECYDIGDIRSYEEVKKLF